MKKIKTILCIAILSISLVGNVQANNTLTSSVSTFFESVVEYISSAIGGDDNCPLRICQLCKPGSNCRPNGE